MKPQKKIIFRLFRPCEYGKLKCFTSWFLLLMGQYHPTIFHGPPSSPFFLDHPIKKWRRRTTGCPLYNAYLVSKEVSPTPSVHTASALWKDNKNSKGIICYLFIQVEGTRINAAFPPQTYCILFDLNICVLHYWRPISDNWRLKILEIPRFFVHFSPQRRKLVAAPTLPSSSSFLLFAEKGRRKEERRNLFSSRFFGRKTFAVKKGERGGERGGGFFFLLSIF